jgi:hypothetical protein
MPFQVIEFDPHQVVPLLEACRSGVNILVVQCSFWPAMLTLVRRRYPQLRLFIRVSNAEALQHLHRNPLRWASPRRSLRILYDVVGKGWTDLSSRRIADGLLGISDWDNENYWRWLPGKAALHYVPYFSCWPDLRSDVVPLPWDLREPQIVCMPGGRDAIGADAIRGFLGFAATSDFDGGHAWSFIVTSGVMQGTAETATFPPYVRRVTTADPWRLLCQSKAVALLSPLGFGMKTTVIDGLAAGCHVIAHPKLSERLPLVVRDQCLFVDPRNSLAVRHALARLREPPTADGVNTSLKDEALRAARQAFRCAGGSDER